MGYSWPGVFPPRCKWTYAEVFFIYICSVIINWGTNIIELGSDYISRAGPVSRAASLCRDDFQPSIT